MREGLLDLDNRWVYGLWGGNDGMYTLPLLCLSVLKLCMMTPRGHKSCPPSSGQFLGRQMAMSTKTAVTNLLNLSEKALLSPFCCQLDVVVDFF